MIKSHAVLNKCSILLKKKYGLPRHGNKSRPFDELVYILLSRQTNEKNFKTAYRQLKGKCRSWNSLARLSAYQIKKHIAVAGFGDQRAKELKTIAHKLIKDFGCVSLSPLKRMTTLDAEKYLCSLPGVGKKSARCVLMYSLNKKVFPVDIHCFRIMNRMGLIERQLPVRNHEDDIQDLVPQHNRYALHVNFVALGRDACYSKNPDCMKCPISSLCQHYTKNRIERLVA